MRRIVRVLLTAGFAAAMLLLVPTSALAYIGQRGDPHPLGLVNTILIFVGGPVGVFLIIAALTLRPQRGAGALRYRPGRSWPYPITWFGTRAPVAPEDATPAGLGGAGGASGSW